MTEEAKPTTEQVQAASLQLLGELTQHASEMTELVQQLNARVEGAMAVAEVVDDNADQVASENWLRAQKDAISHLYGEAQRYTTVVIAGAYVAYFTTLSAVSARFKDDQLRVSALLMTASLSIFVLYEVVGMALVSLRVLGGTLDKERSGTPARVGWGLAMIGTLATALPAIGLSLFVYLKGLGLPELLGNWASR